MKVSVGSISEGTLRPQDLVKTFSKTVLEYDPQNKMTLLIKGQFDDPDYWEDDNELDSDIRMLFDELDLIAEEDGSVYFGTLEGDGACFGFFPLTED
jgi:hypothetical protein